MHYRQLGNTDLSISEVGLGTWQLGGDWGGVEDAQAQKILSTAVESGINFFDTADVYGEGLSEERIGRFLKTCNKKIFVATKVGRFPQPGWPENYSFDIFKEHAEASLRRLNVEVIDLLQIHCIPEEYLFKGEVFEWISRLKKQGLIRYGGVSVESMIEALYCIDQEECSSIQIIFNMFRQKGMDLMFDQILRKPTGVIARLPLASGLLTGKFSKDTQFNEYDHRFYNKDGEKFNVGETFAGIPFVQGLELVEGLKHLLPKDRNLTQTALRWILDFERVSTIIPGCSSVKHVQENAVVSDLASIETALWDDIRSFYTSDVHPHVRGKY